MLSRTKGLPKRIPAGATMLVDGVEYRFDGRSWGSGNRVPEPKARKARKRKPKPKHEPAPEPVSRGLDFGSDL